MRERRAEGSRWIVSLLVLLAGLGLALGLVGRLEAAQSPAWEALGPPEASIGRLFTPTSGALLARGSEVGWLRSDDGGLSWAAVASPDREILAVSSTNHQVLYAAGQAGLFRSEDGGAEWRLVSNQPRRWVALEVSPANPAVLYAVERTSPPADYGTNSWHEFLVSRDGGASWEHVRTQREQILPGTQPCGYAVWALRPHGIDPRRVLTIEGCTGRGMDPLAGQSLDEGRNVALFPDFGEAWGARAVVGGGGANPGRWYAALYRAGSPYSRIYHSRLLRSDDDGLSWTTLLESESGGTSPDTAKPVDMVTALAYYPERPDELYVIVQHSEPQVQDSGSVVHRPTSTRARMSRDGGATWSDLGGADLTLVTDLAVGIDGRYLFAATDKGVYRIALSR